MMDRLSCCIPGCRRTTKAGHLREWLCSKHWALVPKRLKHLKRQAERKNRQWLARHVWVRCRTAALYEVRMGAS